MFSRTRSISASASPRPWLTPLLALIALSSSACSGEDIVRIDSPLEPAPSDEQPADEETPPRDEPPANVEPAPGNEPSEEPTDEEETPVEEEQPPAEETPAETSLYAVSSLVFSPETTSTYVSLIDSLTPQSVSLEDSYEFTGTGDLWVNAGEVFVADSESVTVTKYAVEGRDLVDRDRLSFAAYGLTSLGFWLNKFISPTKAYLLNGASEVIVWNPESMEITGTIPLPEIEVPVGFQVFNGYSDRAAVVRDGKLYQTLYFTDESFFQYTPSSAIAVFDVETDQLLQVLDAPCPGLDYATQDDNGDIYFSAWVYAPGGAVALNQPSTCVVRIPSGSDTPEVAFTLADVTDGREGGVMTYLGDGHALISVLHDERVELTPDTDPSAVAFANNWRFWNYDIETGTAEPIESIDFNAGAQYSFDIDGTTRMLVALADYSATDVYDVTTEGEVTKAFGTTGWAVRLFKVR